MKSSEKATEPDVSRSSRPVARRRLVRNTVAIVASTVGISGHTVSAQEFSGERVVVTGSRDSSSGGSSAAFDAFVSEMVEASNRSQMTPMNAPETQPSQNNGVREQVKTAQKCGNPVLPATGTKIEEDVDFKVPDSLLKEFKRTWNGGAYGWGIFGYRIFTAFDRRVDWMQDVDDHGNPVSDPYLLVRNEHGDVAQYWFHHATGTYRAGGPVGAVDWVAQNGSGWINYASDGSEFHFDEYGRLTLWRGATGESWQLHYSTHFYVGQRHLTHAVHSSGRTIRFEVPVVGYQAKPVTRVWDTAGNAYTYAYTPQTQSWLQWLGDMLASVTYPSGTSNQRVDSYASHVISYEYSNSNLTGKFINGVRYSRFEYDSLNRATLSEHAGGVDRYTFQYLPGRQTKVTSPLGRSTTFTFDLDAQVVSSVGAAGVFCPAMNTTVVIDKAARTITRTDENGYVTRELHDATGNVIERVSGVGTADPQITTFVWDTRPRRLRVVTTSTSRVTATYTTTNRIQSVTTEDLTPHSAPPQTTTYSYSEANGLVTRRTVNGPIPGDGDIVVETFSAQGDLTAIAKSSGSMFFSGHSGLGLPATVVHPNGLTEQRTYDSRGQLITSSRQGAVAKTAYLATGEIGEETDFDNHTKTYYYSAARRLTSVQWNDSFRASTLGLGSAIQGVSFDYDLEGNLTRERYWGTGIQAPFPSPTPAPPPPPAEPPPPPPPNCGPSYIICHEQRAPASIADEGPRVSAQFSATSGGQVDSLIRQYFYDEAGRLRQSLESNGQSLTYYRHPGGQVHTVIDSTGRAVERNSYDAHWRLQRFTNAKDHFVQYSYDDAGRVREVRDPRGLITSFAYDGFGNLRQLISPDTGVTNFGYNAAGLRDSENRSDGTSVVMSYFADGRLNSATASRAGSTITRTYSYDSCINGSEQICSISESTGESIAYEYNQLGQLTAQTNSIGGINLAVRWSYAPSGRPLTLTYPNGVSLDLSSQDGALRGIRVVSSAQQTWAASAVQYRPEGTLEGFRDLRAQQRSFNYDLSGRTTSIGSSTGTLTLGYNTRNLIATATGGAISSAAYDALDQVTSVVEGGSTNTFTHDENGNRTQAQYGGSSLVVYSPSATSNRLSSLYSGSSGRSFAYDQRGNLIRDQRSGITDCHGYDSFGRHSTFVRYSGSRDCSNPGIAPTSVGQYRFNPLNQRSMKTTGGITSRFVYGASGELLFEQSSVGSSRAYVWLDGSIIAMVDGSQGQVFDVHSDYLGRPWRVHNQSGSIVWSAANKAFDRQVTYNLIGDLNLGFPGQYLDAESSLWQNWHRSYDPSIGRYTQSDPIGLDGGINTYAYAFGNPLTYTDPEGLNPSDKWYGFNQPAFRDYVHGIKQEWDLPKGYVFSQEDLKGLHKAWIEEGEPRGKGGKSGKGGRGRDWIKRIKGGGACRGTE